MVRDFIKIFILNYSLKLNDFIAKIADQNFLGFNLSWIFFYKIIFWEIKKIYFCNDFFVCKVLKIEEFNFHN